MSFLYLKVSLSDYFITLRKQTNLLDFTEPEKFKSVESNKAAVTSDNDFITAASLGNLELLRKIFDNAENDDIRLRMISANNYDAFIKASEGGHRAVVKQISDWAPEFQGKMIATAAYSPFTLACSNGHLDVLDFIYSSVSLKVLTKMITGDNCRPIRAAIAKNHANVVGLLCSWLEDKTALLSFLKSHLQSQTPEVREEIALTIDFINKKIIPGKAL